MAKIISGDPAGDDGDLGAGVAAAMAPAAAGGQVVQGTEQIMAKIGQARALAAEDPPLPEIPPEMAGHAALLTAERRRQFLDQYTAVELPGPDQQALLGMLAAPGGVSTRAAAAALPWSHNRVHQQLQRWQREDLAELRGRGSGRRWHLTGRAAGQAPPGAAYPPLHAVPRAGSDAR